MSSKRTPHRLFVLLFSVSLSVLAGWLAWPQTTSHAESARVDKAASVLLSVDCASSPWLVSDSVSWNEAIACYNGKTGGAHQIVFQADVVLTATVDIDNSSGATLAISGDGYTLDGANAFRPVAMIDGVATIDSLTVTNGYESRTPELDGFGGGIFIASGQFTLTNSAVISNYASDWGGGIHLEDSGILVVENSEIAYNRSGSGGGLGFGEGNHAYIRDSSIHHNDADYGSAINNPRSTIFIERSSIFANYHDFAASPAVLNEDGEMHFINSTVSHNDTGGQGGIQTIASPRPATTYLTHTTVFSNGGRNLRMHGSGLLTAYVHGSIVGDSDENCSITGSGEKVISMTYSLADDDSCFTGGVDGNVETADLGVGDLQDYGDGVWAHGLLSDSVAIDVIPFGANGCGTTSLDDQRGEPRPNKALCDVGAFEVQSCVSPFLADSEATLNEGIDCFNWTIAGVFEISVTQDIDLLADTLLISNTYSAALQLSGNGFAVDGGGVARVLHASGSEVGISGITITNGYIDDVGGGLRLDSGSVFTLTDSVVSDNVARSGAGVYISDSHGRIEGSTISGNDAFSTGGGGMVVRDDSYVSVLNSTIYSNTAGNVGGAIRVVGSGTVLTVAHSTVAGNYAAGEGGGIQVPAASVLLPNSTVSQNRAGSNGGGVATGGTFEVLFSSIVSNTVITGTGGGIYELGGTTNLTGTLLAHNSGGDCNGTVIDGGYNLDSDASCGFSGTSLSGEEPLLGGLQDNGGETWTHALLETSPAFNQVPIGEIGCGITMLSDQRNESRPQWGFCEIGAYEIQTCPNPYVVNSESDLNVAIGCFNTTVVGPYAIMLAGDITLLTDTTTIDNSYGATLNLEGSGYTIDGNDQALPLHIEGSIVSMNGITVVNGFQSAGNGGGLDIGSGSVFTLSNSVFADNEVSDDGGAVQISGGSDGRIENSRFAHNHASARGGAIVTQNNSDVVIVDTTFYSNTSGTAAGALRVSGSNTVLTVTGSLFQDNETITGNGGGIQNRQGVVHLINSTLSGNRAGGAGGAIQVNSVVYMTHTTVVSNVAPASGGIHVATGDTAVLFSSIIAHNGISDCSGDPVTDGGYNLDSDGSCNLSGTGSESSADPDLLPLADNGGESLTHALPDTSIALNKIPIGTNGCGTLYVTDQRGGVRPDGVTDCDMGAYEAGYCLGSPYVVDSELTFNRAIDCYNQSVSGQTVVNLATDITLLTDTVAIDNDSGATLWIGGNDYTLDGNGNGRPISMNEGDTTVDSLTVVNGYTAENGGGILVNQGTFTLTYSTIFSNTAVGNGGGIHVAYGGSLVVLNSEIVSNQAVTSGGGIDFRETSIGHIENSTIHDNIGFAGGGVAAYRANVVVLNTAIYDNLVPSGTGGGVFNDQGYMWLTNSTVSGNGGGTGNGISIVSYNGVSADTYLLHTSVISNGSGNIQVSADASVSTLYLDSSIVAHGTTSDCSEIGTGTTAIVATYSLDSDGSCVTDGADGNVSDSEPKVWPLQDNGGETWTHALQYDSPAIDGVLAGSNGCQTSITTDQRGEARNDWACDLGAYEAQFSDIDTVSQTVTMGEATSFGPTLVHVDVVDDGGCLTGLLIQRIESDHPNATVGIASGRYWDINPMGCTSGFTVTLTLPYDMTPSISDKACRYTGSSWDCGDDSENSSLVNGPMVMPNIVARTEVTEFSPWAVGISVNPTAVTLQSFLVKPNSWSHIILYSFILLVVVTGGALAVVALPSRRE